MVSVDKNCVYDDAVIVIDDDEEECIVIDDDDEDVVEVVEINGNPANVENEFIQVDNHVHEAGIFIESDESVSDLFGDISDIESIDDAFYESPSEASDINPSNYELQYYEILDLNGQPIINVGEIHNIKQEPESDPEDNTFSNLLIEIETSDEEEQDSDEEDFYEYLYQVPYIISDDDDEQVDNDKEENTA